MGKKNFLTENFPAGTASYLTPQRKPDDLYALGRVYHFLLSGQFHSYDGQHRLNLGPIKDEKAKEFLVCFDVIIVRLTRSKSRVLAYDDRPSYDYWGTYLNWDREIKVERIPCMTLTGDILTALNMGESDKEVAINKMYSTYTA